MAGYPTIRMESAKSTEYDAELLVMFEAAVEHVKAKSRNYSTKQKLILYGLYRQATLGNINVKRPGKSAGPQAVDKWEAWNACKDVSLNQAMDQYVKYLQEIDKGFKANADKLSKEIKKLTRGNEDLNTLPEFSAARAAAFKKASNPTGSGARSRDTVPSPEAVGRVMKGQKSHPSTDDLKAHSGFDPAEGAYESDGKLDLHAKLTKFYNKHDPDRARQGIGNIVEFALREGEAKLNAELRKKYKSDLVMMDEEEEKLARDLQKQLNDRAEAKAASSKTDTGDEQIWEDLRDRLADFFRENDEARLRKGLETNFAELIQYAKTKSIAALNTKLMKKYGKDLQGESSAMDLLAPSTGSNSSDVDSADGEERLSRADGSFVGITHLDVELPDFVEPTLKSFYAKYDPESLRNGSCKKVIDWAKRNGLVRLNIELEKRFKQTLDDFIRESHNLSTELREFYTSVDPTKLDTDFEKILSWGVKNGRLALNIKLSQKYGFDLDTYKTGGKGTHEDEVPDF